MKNKLLIIIFLLLPAWILAQGVTIGEDTYVTVSGGGKLLVNDGQLKILATGNGMGSLLENDNANNTVSVSGTNAQTVVQSYITADKWHYVSSPLTNATSNTFFEMWLKPFVESTNTWGDYITPTTDPLTIGKGYAVYSFSSGTPSPGTKSVEYVSTSTNALNSGTISPAVSWSGTNFGNNLVGNPYTSAIDWNAASGWTRTNIGNTIYFWHADENQYAAYPKNESAGTLEASNIILPGQGFFVQATGSPALSMTNSVRVHAGADQTILKTNHSWLKIGVEEEGEQLFDETMISFRPEGNPALNEFDADKWFSPEETVPDLYITKEDKSLAVGAFGIFNRDMIIPLNFSAGTVGDVFRIFVTDMASNPDFEQVFLKDKVTGVTTDLTQTAEYLFTAQPNDDPARFEVFFKEAYGIAENEQNPVLAYYANGQLNIRSHSQETLNGNMTVYNVIGQPVFSEKILQGNETVSFNVSLPDGVYMIVIQVNEKRITEKIFIN